MCVYGFRGLPKSQLLRGQIAGTWKDLMENEHIEQWLLGRTYMIMLLCCCRSMSQAICYFDLYSITHVLTSEYTSEHFLL
jgi:hypothetical protein